MRFAVLGCGSIGRRHLRTLRELGQTDLLAFDPAPQARQALESEYGIKCFDLLEDVWSQKPDAALITAPSAMHADLALAAAEHHCHLFIEKPLAHSLDGVHDLLKTVEQRGLITMVGCNMRFHQGPLTVKRLIDEQAVGKILGARIQTGSYLPNWRPGQNYHNSYSASTLLGGGALLDCIHEVDLALWYFGPGHLVAALTQPAFSLELEVEGLAELLIQHDGGAIASVHLNFVQKDYRRGCQVIGDQGTIYWDFSQPQVTVRGGDGESRHELNPAWKIDQMYVDELSYFIDCVEKGTQTFCSAKEGLAALQIVLDAKAVNTASAAKTRPA